ncbi:hypothetical protein PMZ80_007001 [Knufia obscura]|uniref:Ubiquitin carboxyl-terminal hydrolase n=2 Tax=Knufia TaxID=430999 RepID=A0AAN8EJW9_9EURO|nr:hypothetical protein PMZ80_007001 [Knufia obscura]KAK5957539.1 hypothetical protein OHC33_001915 [Knufia fluminis]
MSSFFGKLKSNTDSRNASTTSPAKNKPDPNATQPTPLERMLQNAGPLRHDGSDKFYGMENFGNTCYCNSILQSLYYSVPFRENIISYPSRSSPESISTAAASAPPRPKYPPPGQKPPAPKPGVTPQSQQQKAEDKDSPEYKKKQALLAGPILNMSYENANAYQMPDSLYSSVKDIFEAVVTNEKRHGIVSPSKLVEVLRRDNEMFRGQLHQDAHEFFNLLLNTLLDNIDDNERKKIEAEAEAKVNGTEKDAAGITSEPVTETGTVSFPSLLPIAQPGPTKWLRDMFEGTLTSETRCLTCENVSQRDEPFLDLSVDLDQHTSVTSCLRRFSEEEMLCERNKFHCDNCGGLQEAEKRMKIKSLPKVLTLHLKRFKYTEDFGRLQKLFHKVVYPYHLRLFNTTDDAGDPDRIYELYAVVVHIGGGPFHGHYVAVIKTQDRGWLLFDDEMVEPVDKSYVKNFFGDKPGLATAYVLFYQETTMEAVRAEQKRESKKRRASQVTMTEAKAQESAELHQVRSTSPVSPIDKDEMTNLDHAVTAPPMTNGHVDPKTPPFAPQTPPLIQVPQSKKEKAKTEKEQKAAAKLAEKEAKKQKEKEEKEKRAALHDRLGEAARQNAEQMRWAMEESKKVAKEEAARRGEEAPVMNDEAPTNGSPSAMDNIFRRSKSLRFGSIGKPKEMKKPVLDQENHKMFSADSRAATEQAIDESHENNKDGKEKEKEKKNRFSLRKKSFGLLSS